MSDGLQDPSRSASLLLGVQLLLDVLRRTLPAHGSSCGLPLRELHHEMVSFDRMGVAGRRYIHLRWRQGFHPRRNQPVSYIDALHCSLFIANLFTS